MVARHAPRQVIEERYQLQEELGRGGFGVVWRARDTLLERDVAVKEIEFPSVLEGAERASLRERVLREARAAARLSHPGTVTVFDVVEDDGRPLIVMELIDSPTLAQVVARDGPLDPASAAAIGVEVLDTLQAAHAQGIVHRDVKPANVMVSDSGRVRLADFGIAAIIDDPRVTTSGALVGSPSYMAPEQATNQGATPATDLWGLGATLYFAVEGEPPFDKGSALPTMAALVNEEPRPPSRAGRLAPIIASLLAKDPTARPAPAEVARRLSAVLPRPPIVDATAELDIVIDAPGSIMGDGRATVEPPAPAPLVEPPQPLIDPSPSDPEEPAPVAPPVVEPPPRPPVDVPPPAEPSPPPPAEPPAPVPHEPPAQPPVEPPARPPVEPPVQPPVERPAPVIREKSRTPSLLVPLTLIAMVAVVMALVVATGNDDNDRSPRSPTATDDAGDADDADDAGETRSSQPAPQAAAPQVTVPADWVDYRDPETGFTISHPPAWQVQRNGSLTDFRDPATGAYLRVDYTRSPKPSPEGAWLDFEPTFAAQNPGYQRIRITPTTYAGFPAAEWEFTYRGRGAELRAVDLGFVTGEYGFALNFQSRAGDWERMQPTFEAFKAAFKAP